MHQPFRSTLLILAGFGLGAALFSEPIAAGAPTPRTDTTNLAPQYELEIPVKTFNNLLKNSNGLPPDIKAKLSEDSIITTKPGGTKIVNRLGRHKIKNSATEYLVLRLTPAERKQIEEYGLKLDDFISKSAQVAKELVNCQRDVTALRSECSSDLWIAENKWKKALRDCADEEAEHAKCKKELSTCTKGLCNPEKIELSDIKSDICN